jgi:hypothetical protein
VSDLHFLPRQIKIERFCSYLLSTAHAALMLYELIVGFTQTSTDVEEKYYFTYGTPQAIAMVKNMIYVVIVSALFISHESSMSKIWVFQSIAGDGIVFWRLFIIWNGNYWISALPGVVIAATCGELMIFVCSMSLISFMPIPVTGIIGSCAYVLPTNSGLIGTETALRLLASSLILSLGCNILLTGLIAGRIMYDMTLFLILPHSIFNMRLQIPATQTQPFNGKNRSLSTAHPNYRRISRHYNHRQSV